MPYKQGRSLHLSDGCKTVGSQAALVSALGLVVNSVCTDLHRPSQNNSWAYLSPSFTDVELSVLRTLCITLIRPLYLDHQAHKPLFLSSLTRLTMLR